MYCESVERIRFHSVESFAGSSEDQLRSEEEGAEESIGNELQAEPDGSESKTWEE